MAAGAESSRCIEEYSGHDRTKGARPPQPYYPTRANHRPAGASGAWRVTNRGTSTTNDDQRGREDLTAAEVAERLT